MKLDDSTISKNISIATEFFKVYQAVKVEKLKKKLINYSGGTTGFIPFTIDFTLDGISGIKIYDKLIVDSSFLPIQYPRTLEFIVTGIDHSIKDGDWETNIKVTLIPKFEEITESITAIDSNIVTYQIPLSPVKTPISPAIIGTLTNNLIIGDSITPNFALNTYNKANLGLYYTATGVLWESGKGVEKILEFANAYTLKSTDIKNVIITIGTNDLYIRDKSTVKQLAERLKLLFPNAKLFVIQGGYGPLLGEGQTDKYGSYKTLQNMLQSTVDTYYKDFSDNGITVITPAIGNVADVHSPRLPIYEAIGKELLKLLKR